jgi:microcystin-dependent protein
MSDTLSALLKLVLQETGGNEDIWGEILNAQLEAAEDAIAGEETIVVTNGTVTLTDAQARAMIMHLSGTLVDNVIIEVPARTKMWVVRNATAQGAFTVSLKVAGIAGTTAIPALASKLMYCTGSEIGQLQAAGGVAVGSIIDYGGTSVPADYLECVGTAISRVTYSALFAQIGTTWGIGDGSTTFNLPDTRDRWRVSRGSVYSMGSTVAQDVQSHTHAGSSIVLPDHTHTLSLTIDAGGGHYHSFTGANSNTGAPGGTPGFFFGTTTFNTDAVADHSHGASGTAAAGGGGTYPVELSATGGTYTRPNSVTVMTLIRYA